MKELQKNLAVVNESRRFRHVQNVKSKLKWYFQLSDKALALQKYVEWNLRVIDAFTWQRTSDMLHSLLSSFLEDVSKSLEEKLNVQLPALQTSLLNALSKRDVLLQVQLEKLFESYLDSQRIQFSPSPATIIAAESVYNPAMLKGNVSHVKLKFPLATKPDLPHISGVFQAAEEIVQAIQSRWSLKSPDILWFQNCSRLMDEHSVSWDLIDFAKDAREVAALGYFCQRVDPEGVPFDKAEKFRDLFYSLIRQLCTSIAEDLIPSLDLNGSAFRLSTAVWSRQV